jgi:hypothetical protein
MSERLSLVVDDGVGALLVQLAGGERRRGAYLSALARSLATAEGAAFGTQALAVQGLAARMGGIEGRIEALEMQLAAVIAQSAG